MGVENLGSLSRSKITPDDAHQAKGDVSKLSEVNLLTSPFTREIEADMASQLARVREWEAGGRLVAAGTPEQVMRKRSSHTAQALKKVLHDGKPS